MKISLNWLKNYIDISNIPIDDLAHKLTMAGLEVESIEHIGEELRPFIVGEVVEKTSHPNAEKLSICEVNTGTETLTVVCGAPNVDKGQKIVFAPIGVTMPSTGEKLKKVKIRGVESNGMICSEKELNLGDDHTGIMVLEENAEIGSSIVDYFKLSDVVFEVGVTPNRPDVLSHIGVAREISAIFKKDYTIPKIDIDEVDESIDNYLSVELLNEKDCPRYTARMVRNVKVKESPQWLKNYLINVGLRPINNIVDISNFVMLEFGQPLHTFDANLIDGKKIIVRNAIEGDQFLTLDGKERKLSSNNLMICDTVKYVAIAGVMGGLNSEINENTKDVIIESAYFNPASIRRTSKYLGLSSESSYRFERGVDYNNCLVAANRAAQLIAEIAGGEVLSNYIDEFPNRITEVEVPLRIDRACKVLGVEISREEVCDILDKLEIKYRKSNGGMLTCIAPSFRPDLTREIDLIEEIARIYGYDLIPIQSSITFRLDALKNTKDFESEVKQILVGLGFNEIVSNSLFSEDEASFNELRPIKILNPISNELSYLRTSLIPGLLKSVSLNQRFSEFNLQLFEIGKIFVSKTDAISDFKDFDERTNLTLCLTGSNCDINWQRKEKWFDIFEFKGIINELLNKISLDKVTFNSYHTLENSYYDIEIKVFTDNTYIGSLYRLKMDYLSKFEIEREVYAGEFDYSLISQIPKVSKKFKQISNYPVVERDISFFISNGYSYAQVEEQILKINDKLLKGIRLFDQYVSKDDPTRKSFAIRLEFQSNEKTLTSEEVEKRVKKIVSSLEKQFNIQLRTSSQ